MIKLKNIYVCVLTFLSLTTTVFSQEYLHENNEILQSEDKEIDLLYESKNEYNNIYSISHIKSDDLSKTTSLNSTDSWRNRLSGFYSDRVRGLASINQGPILFILDGFQTDASFINNIDIEEIESVTIMKDAPSTALYGIRGANGIVSINTKRGFVGKPKIQVNATYGLQNIIEIPQFYNTYDYTGLYNEALLNDGLSNLFTEDQRNTYPDTDWYNEALNDFAPLAKVDFSIRGGVKRVKYYVYVNYFNSQGFFKNTGLNKDYSIQENNTRYNFRSNFDIQVFEKTTLKADVGGYLYDLHGPRHSRYEIFDAIQTMPPIIQGIYDDGIYGGSATYRNNPLALINNAGYTKNHQRAFNFNLKLIQDLDMITEGLRFNGVVNINNFGNYVDTWGKDFRTQSRIGNEIINFGFEGSLWSSSWFTQFRNMGCDLYFDYNKSWDNSKLTALLGYRASTQTASGRNQTINHLDTYGKISYSYLNKYFADLVMGYNGSQHYDKGKRFGFFPALALGWLVSEEEGFHNSKIDLLKIRASIGLTGSDYVEDAYKFMYSQVYMWGNGYYLRNDNSSVGGIYEGMPAYPNAKWENSLKANLGLDFGINNFKFGVDLYTDYRYDILVSRDGFVPDLIGINLPMDNKGRAISYGLETTVDYTYKLNSFAFNFGGFFNFNKSKILEMNEIPRPFPYLERTKKPIGQYFGLEHKGFFQDQADIENSPFQTFSSYSKGDIKYVDQNNDGIIDDFDMVAIGKSWFPEIIFAFEPSIAYKNFTVEALFQGVVNRSIYLNTSQFWGFYNQKNIASNAVEGRWTEETKANATLPRLTTVNNENNYRLNDLWVTNGNFLKLRYLELRYDFKKEFLSTLNIVDAQIFIRSDNLLFFDHIKNADPENLGPVPTTSLKNIGFKITF